MNSALGDSRRRSKRLLQASSLVAVAALVIAAGMTVFGAEYHLLTGPPREETTSSGWWYRALCPTGAGLCANLSTASTEVVGAAYIYSGTRWVGALDHGPIFQLASDGREMLSALMPSCAPNSLYYPGTGWIVFVDCRTAQSDNVLLYNWSTSSVVGAIDLHSNESCERGLSFNSTGSLLYCPDAAMNGSLRTVAVGNRSIVASVPLPNGTNFPCATAYDRLTGAVIYISNSGKLVDAVDPASGQLLHQAALQERASGFAYSGALSRLLVPTSGLSPQSTGGDVLVLNSSSLRLVSSVYVPGLVVDAIPFIDSQRDQGYALTTSGWAVLDLASLGGFSTVPVPPSALPDTFPIAFDTTDRVFGGAQTISSPFPSLAFQNITESSSEAPPYSTLPVFGPQWPLVLGIAGAAILVGAITAHRQLPTRSRG